MARSAFLDAPSGFLAGLDPALRLLPRALPSGWTDLPVGAPRPRLDAGGGVSARGPAPAGGRAGPVRGRRRVRGGLVPPRLPGGSPACRDSRAPPTPTRWPVCSPTARRAGASVPGRGGALPLRLAVRAPLRPPDEHGLDEPLRQGPGPRAVRRGGADPAGARRSGREGAAAGPGPGVGLGGAADPGRGGDPRQVRLVPARRTGRAGHPTAAPGARARWAAGATSMGGTWRRRDGPPPTSSPRSPRCCRRPAGATPPRPTGSPGCWTCSHPVRRPPRPRCSGTVGSGPARPCGPRTGGWCSSTPTAPGAATRAVTWAPPWRTCAGRRSAGPVSDQRSAGRSRRCWPGTSTALRSRTARRCVVACRRPAAGRAAALPPAGGLAVAAAARARRGGQRTCWPAPPRTQPSPPPPVEPAPTDLLDVRQMTRVLRPALAARLGDAHPVEVESAVELEAAHGGRSVVGYTVRGLDGPRSTYLVGKRFERAASGAAAPRPPGPARLRTLRLRSAPGPRRGGVPPRTRDGRLPALRGHPAAPDPVAREHHARRPPRGTLAGTAAHLRRPPAPHLLPRPGAADHPRVGGAHRRTPPRPGRPRRTARRRLGEPVPARRSPWSRCRSTRTSIPGTSSSVTDVCVIDLDEARQRRPGLRRRPLLLLPRAAVARTRRGPRRAFLEEYADATGWADPGTYRAFSRLHVAEDRQAVRRSAAGPVPRAPGRPSPRRTRHARWPRGSDV